MNSIASHISDDFEAMMDNGHFDCPVEANEHLLDVVRGQSISYVSNGAIDAYTFRDNSVISFKGNYYLVQTGKAA